MHSDLCVTSEELSEIHLHAWLFSNPRGKVEIIDGTSCSPDLTTVSCDAPESYKGNQISEKFDTNEEVKWNLL